MDKSIAALAGLFKFDDTLFLEKVSSLDDKALDTRVADSVNSARWLAGHLTSTRIYLLGLMGAKLEYSWTSLFSEKYDPAKQYPVIADIKEAWMATSEELGKRLAGVTEEDLVKPIEPNLPHGDKTIRGAITFFAYHEAWHIGQIAFLRRQLDMDGVVPY